jgi:transposase
MIIRGVHGDVQPRVADRVIRGGEPAGVSHLRRDERRGERAHTEQLAMQRDAGGLVVGDPDQLGTQTSQLRGPQVHDLQADPHRLACRRCQLGGRRATHRRRLKPGGRRVIEVALSVIDHLSAEIDPLRAEITDLARHQTGCRALMSHYGIGALTAPIIWAEMGHCRRLSSSDKAVRHTGLDITVWSSDNKRAGGGHLARQGPPALRWALVEAAQSASRSSSPDHAYYLEVKDRAGANRAALSVARKLARRTHHTLRALGDAAWAEAA